VVGLPLRFGKDDGDRLAVPVDTVILHDRTGIARVCPTVDTVGYSSGGRERAFQYRAMTTLTPSSSWWRHNREHSTSA